MLPPPLSCVNPIPNMKCHVQYRFVWKWTTDGAYSASTAYRAFFFGLSSLLGAKELWAVQVPPRDKFSFGLPSMVVSGQRKDTSGTDCRMMMPVRVRYAASRARRWIICSWRASTRRRYGFAYSNQSAWTATLPLGKT